MCGIFAYLGENEGIALALDALAKLEYRGYDSCGIAGVQEGSILLYKNTGKVDDLKRILPRPWPSLHCIIAHTRWATHGKPSNINAHPHTDEAKTLALVHNGIIENEKSLRSELTLAHHMRFSSETDTEAAAQLLAHLYKGDFFSAAVRCFSQLEGSFAIAAIHKDFPGNIVAVAKESPLHVASDKLGRNFFVVSDVHALPMEGLDVFDLKEGQIAWISLGKPMQFFDRKGQLIHPIERGYSREKDPFSKEIYPHFMLKEIFEQELVAKNVLNTYVDQKSQSLQFPSLKKIENTLLDLQEITIVACGTSYHAALVAERFFTSIAGVETKAYIASEYRYQNHRPLGEKGIILALSQSGETADTLAATTKSIALGERVIAICNSPGSTIDTAASATLFIEAGKEVAVASTKTLIAQLLILFLFALYIAEKKGKDKNMVSSYLKEALQVPRMIADVLDRHKEVEKIAAKYCSFHDFYFLGRQELMAIAFEGALKLKEIAYKNAVGYPAAEMKHGPIALISDQLPVVILASSNALFAKLMGNLRECKARSAPIIVAASACLQAEFCPVADDFFCLPDTSDPLSTMPSAVFVQLFAYYTARVLNLDIDHPKNLAKSVTVE